MATLAEIRALGTDLETVSTPLSEPLNAPKRFEQRMERFGEHYDTTQDSHLYRFLISLCGDAGAGSLKRELLYPRLQQLVSSTYFTDIDKLYGNPLGVSRLPKELYIYDPHNEALTQEQWIEVFAKDASYRERCLLWMRAIIEGPTPRGIAMAAEAACGIECDVYENYQYLDNNLLSRRSFTLLTFTGNEINDEMRIAGIEGDGRIPETSYGVWEASENLALNSTFDNALAEWTIAGTGTIVASINGKFGDNCARVQGTAANDGVVTTPGTLTNGVTYTGSIWHKGSVTAGTCQLVLGDAFGSTSTTNFTPSVADWQRAKVTWTATANPAFLTVKQSAIAVMDVRIDGTQIEAQPLATPFIRTIASPITRAVGKITANSALLNTTQGWVAARVRPNWAAADNIYSAGAFPAVFYWGEDTSDRLHLSYELDNNRWRAERNAGGAGAAATSASSFAADVATTLIFAWTDAIVKISVDGAAFTSTANTSIPTLATPFYLGNRWDDARAFDGEILGIRGGVGTLTNTDAATLHTILLNS